MMNRDQKEQVQWSLDWTMSRLQAIEAEPMDLHDKRDRVEWQLILFLEDVINALPKAMREQARACLNVQKRLEEAVFEEIAARNAAWQAHEKASSQSLATVS